MADTDQVLNLAAIIREVDGTHSKGAAALAEPILDHPRFRAVLAGKPAVPEGREPAAVTGQPSDEELALIYHDCCRGCEFMDQVNFENAARAVLTRWGNPAPPSADAEVAELVEWLRETGDTIQPSHLAEHQRYKRAAELLERLSPPQPVPVGERPWEREGWCDTDGLCWLGSDALDGCTPTWLYGPPAWAERFPTVHRVVLPAHALPLPEVGE